MPAKVHLSSERLRNGGPCRWKLIGNQDLDRKDSIATKIASSREIANCEKNKATFPRKNGLKFDRARPASKMGIFHFHREKTVCFTFLVSSEKRSCHKFEVTISLYIILNFKMHVGFHGKCLGFRTLS